MMLILFWVLFVLAMTIYLAMGQFTLARLVRWARYLLLTILGGILVIVYYATGRIGGFGSVQHTLLIPQIYLWGVYIIFAVIVLRSRIEDWF